MRSRQQGNVGSCDGGEEKAKGSRSEGSSEEKAKSDYSKGSAEEKGYAGTPDIASGTPFQCLPVSYVCIYTRTIPADRSLGLREIVSRTGRDPVRLIDQLRPIERLCYRDRLAPDDPYLPELRVRFGNRIVDGIAPAARPPRWALAAPPSRWDGDSDLRTTRRTT